MWPFAKDGVFYKIGLVHIAVGGGILAIGYHLGRRFPRSVFVQPDKTLQIDIFQ
jgi:hypothetical protein